MIQLDISKAYYSIHWQFLEDSFLALQFPQKFLDLVMTCVTTPMLSLCINGSVEGFFKGRKGLCQGDPLSPYLFVICI